MSNAIDIQVKLSVNWSNNCRAIQYYLSWTPSSVSTLNPNKVTDDPTTSPHPDAWLSDAGQTDQVPQNYHSIPLLVNRFRNLSRSWYLPDTIASLFGDSSPSGFDERFHPVEVDISVEGYKIWRYGRIENKKGLTDRYPTHSCGLVERAGYISPQGPTLHSTNLDSSLCVKAFCSDRLGKWALKSSSFTEYSGKRQDRLRLI